MYLNSSKLHKVLLAPSFNNNMRSWQVITCLWLKAVVTIGAIFVRRRASSSTKTGFTRKRDSRMQCVHVRQRWETVGVVIAGQHTHMLFRTRYSFAAALFLPGPPGRHADNHISLAQNRSDHRCDLRANTGLIIHEHGIHATAGFARSLSAATRPPACRPSSSSSPIVVVVIVSTRHRCRRRRRRRYSHSPSSSPSPFVVVRRHS